MRLEWLAVVLLGCSGGGTESADAAGPADAAPIDSQVRGPALTHTLFVNTEGVTVLPGANDAANNRTVIVSQPIALRPILSDDPQRQAKIDDILAQLRTILSPYDISVVAARPAAGNYHMVVLTDDNSQLLGLAPDLAASTPSPCNTQPSVISFEFGYSGFTDQLKRDFAVRNAIAMFADEAAVPISTKHGDCMCFSNDECFVGSPCTIGGPGTMIDTTGGCSGGAVGTTMNEGSLFLEVFGPHPAE